MSDRENDWDMLLSDLMYGMNQRPYRYEAKKWDAIKKVSYEISKEEGFA